MITGFTFVPQRSKGAPSAIEGQSTGNDQFARTEPTAIAAKMKPNPPPPTITLELTIDNDLRKF